MKKILKISGIVIAAVILLTVLACIFTGLVPYLITTKYLTPEIEPVYSEWAHYDAGTLSDGKTISYGGLYAIVPEDLEVPEKDGSIKDHIFTNKNSVSDGEKATSLAILDRSTIEIDSFDDIYKMEIEATDLTDKQKKSAEKLMKRYEAKFTDYCGKLGKAEPSNRYEYIDLAYSADPNNTSIIDRDKMTVHAVIMVMRQTMFPVGKGEIYRFETETGKGFISPYGDDGNKFVVELFDNNDLNSSYMMIVSAPDYDTMYKIINSFRIDYKPE